MKLWVITSLLALSGGLIGFLTGFPLGALLGSLIIIAAVQLKTKRLPSLPNKTKRMIQMLLGGSIGLTFNQETFSTLSSIWIPALIVPPLQILFALVLSFLLIKLLKFDALTAICSTAPAGMTEMILLAEKYPNVSLPTVVTLHLYRLLFIVTATPVFIYYVFMP